MEPVRIGTRGSKLALFQANYIAERIRSRGLPTEIVVIETKGDKILDVSISKIGSKGVFTQELEDQLDNGRIDIAVHSAKDMQSNLPEGYEILSFSEREKVNDILLSQDSSIDYKNEERSVVLGTSATRRIATLKHFYPHIKTVEIRGNLQTRIAKMENGLCDGLLLAYAGAHRMGYDGLIRHELSLEEFIPAVGQGSMAVEVASSMNQDLKDAIRSATHHYPTGYRILAERSYLRVLEGGCSIPVFALAEVEDEFLSIKGGIISLDGQERICHSVEGTIKEAEDLGKRLAEKVLKDGGERILANIKSYLNEKN